MIERPLPKQLQHACKVTYADRVDECWTQEDGVDGGVATLSHWIYLKAGWRNARLDPKTPLHAIQACAVSDAIDQLRQAEPCDCEECQRRQGRRGWPPCI